MAVRLATSGNTTSFGNKCFASETWALPKEMKGFTTNQAANVLSFSDTKTRMPKKMSTVTKTALLVESGDWEAIDTDGPSAHNANRKGFAAKIITPDLEL